MRHSRLNLILVEAIYKYQIHRIMNESEFPAQKQSIDNELQYDYQRKLIEIFWMVLDQQPLIFTISFNELYKETLLFRGLYTLNIPPAPTAAAKDHTRQLLIQLLMDVCKVPLDVALMICEYAICYEIALVKNIKRRKNCESETLMDGTFALAPTLAGNMPFGQIYVFHSIS